MNFTTDLPKKDPLVSYIVASAVRCEKFFPHCSSDGPVYRMHAVILKKSHPKLQLPPASPPRQSSSSQEQDQPLSVSNIPTRLTNPFLMQDSDPKAPAPRSSHGRVLTASRRLKASYGGESPNTAHPNQVPN
jgi:hypothetical protein